MPDKLDYEIKPWALEICGVKFVPKFPDIKNVIFNPPATIVMWDDDTKTVVKCGPRDTYDPEKGLAMAVAKKALGNNGNYFEAFKKWVKYEEKSDGCGPDWCDIEE